MDWSAEMEKQVPQMRTTTHRFPLLLDAVCKVTAAFFLLLAAPFTASTFPQSASQSVDEGAVRALTERYGQAITADDVETMRQLWNPQSPNLAVRLRLYQGLFSNTRVEFISMNVTRREVTGDKAVSHLTTDERHLDRKTGAILSARDASHGVCRSFEWIKTSAGWKVEREFTVQDELAARLEATASELERDELLEKEKTFVTDALAYALATRGYRHQLRRNYDAALRCFQLEQAVAEKIGDHAGVAGAWLNFGLNRVGEDDYEQALLFQQKALTLYEADGLQRGVALVLVNLSKVYRSLGDHRQAFDNAQKALRLYEEANNRRGTSEALAEVADVYRAQNNLQQALTYSEKALTIAQELGDKIQIAILRYAVARQHRILGNYERALEIYQELLKQTEGFRDRAGAATIRDAIGITLAAQGRYAEALDYHRRALSELEAVNEKENTAVVLNNMSSAFLAQGKYAEALPLAERAVALSRQAGRQLSLWLALTSLGYCQLGVNQPAEAQQSFAEAISIMEKLRAQTAGGAEERQRYFESRLRAHHGMLKLLAKENRPREALIFAERTKARVLLDVLQQGRVSSQRAMTVEERQQEGRLKLELTRLNTQLARAKQSDKPDPQRVGELTSRLEKARLNYEAFQTSLYAAHPELKIHRGEGPIIRAEELTVLLPDDTSALLEYVVTDEVTYLFAVTKAPGKPGAEVQVFTIPIKRAELVQQTESFREQLAQRDLGFRASALKLYELLLMPAQRQLKGKTNLVIVPDDKLWDLPFQALLATANRFLIEDCTIAYVPSLTVLHEMTKRRKNNDAASATLLALGNPLLGKETIDRATLAVRDDKLDPLPEAEQEVRALGQLYGSPRSKVYIGPEAREDRVKSEAGQARIFHFATHGILNNAAPMYSHLLLAPGAKNEDGLLEAWEMMQLDLKADLAVLSACETARGRFGAGEGMIGLSWALFVAGVPSTVVSQWKVESASTRDLMVSFHRGISSQARTGKTKVTKTEALRQAALKLLKNPETSHPFYWAGFVLVGDGR
jgi:CHAT domain-containing protein